MRDSSQTAFGNLNLVPAAFRERQEEGEEQGMAGGS